MGVDELKRVSAKKRVGLTVDVTRHISQSFVRRVKAKPDGRVQNLDSCDCR